MKRRCAGCSRVIDGWSQKKYCSRRCKNRATKRRLRGDKASPAVGSVSTLIRGSNGVLIETAARLGYLGKPGDTVLDVTYGRGLWWTRYRPACLIQGEGDYRDRPEVAGSITGAVCFDPPYISTGSRDTSTVDDLYDRFGLGELKGWKAVRFDMETGMNECARVLAPGGYLLMKCMDYVESGHKVWNTFHFAKYGEDWLGLRLVDRFIHLSGGGPQVMTNLDGLPRDWKHAREVSSMLLVFRR